MSVINSMLRDLDRRQAPSPFQANAAVKASVQLAPAQPNRMTPRSAIFFCVLIALVILSWGQRSKEAVDSKEAIETTASIQSVDAKIEALSSQPKPIATEKNSTAQLPTSEQENRRLTESFATTRRALSVKESVPIGSEAASMPPTVAANDSVIRLASQKTSSAEKQKSETQTVSQSDTQVSETRTSAPIIKQERNSADDVNAERYQLARNALAQNQPQRAYELLRDNPPALANNSDYHAVLAAAEQQLGHYAEASLRYQQLLMLDQNQASWWLGLALSIDQNRSLDAAQRNNEALAAYQRAVQLNSLPEAARQYAAARIAALNHSAEQ